MELLGVQFRWGSGLAAHLVDNHFSQVDQEGEVIKNAWEDCKAGCPGTEDPIVEAWRMILFNLLEL
jgi:hypothetical protein